MNLRPFLPLLLGAFLLPASMESAHTNRFLRPLLPPTACSNPQQPAAGSDAYVVIKPENRRDPLAERNANRVMSIASITKLMTALVVLDKQSAPQQDSHRHHG